MFVKCCSPPARTTRLGGIQSFSLKRFTSNLKLIRCSPKSTKIWLSVNNKGKDLWINKEKELNRGSSWPPHTDCHRMSCALFTFYPTSHPDEPPACSIRGLQPFSRLRGIQPAVLAAFISCSYSLGRTTYNVQCANLMQISDFSHILHWDNDQTAVHIK